MSCVVSVVLSEPFNYVEKDAWDPRMKHYIEDSWCMHSHYVVLHVIKDTKLHVTLHTQITS